MYKLSVIIPYSNRQEAFDILVQNLPKLNEVEYIFILVNDNNKTVKRIISEMPNARYFDITMDVFSIAECHLIGARKAVANTIMKLDIDTIPNDEFFPNLLQYMSTVLIKREDFINVGCFYMDKMKSGNYLNSVLSYQRFDEVIRYKYYRQIFDGNPSGNLFVCNRELFLEMEPELKQFKGYGWEDYMVLWTLMKGKYPDFELSEYKLETITQRCRDEISHVESKRTFDYSRKLVLLHKHHEQPSRSTGYKDGIEFNRKTLYDNIIKYVEPNNRFIYARSEKKMEEIIGKLEGRTIVVGNGAIKGNEGKEIDSYDNVIRINNFVIKGYEKKVGTKTDIWCSNGYLDIEKRDFEYCVCPFSGDINASQFYNKFEARTGVKILFPTHNYHILKYFPDGIKNTKLFPSTGFCLIMLLLEYLPSIDIIGFDFMKTGHYFGEMHAHGHKNTKVRESEIIKMLDKRVRIFI